MKESIALLFSLPALLLAQQNPGLPVRSQIIEHTGYVLNYDEQHKQAEWVFFG